MKTYSIDWEKAADLTIGIVVSRYNEPIGDMLLDSTIHTLTELGVKKDNLTLVSVPGALEVPLMVHQLMEAEFPDAIIALGSIIRGETSHYDMVVQESARGLSMVGMNFETPVINGILTTENREQAMTRADKNKKNKGGECARTAVEMALLAEMFDAVEIPDMPDYLDNMFDSDMMDNPN